MEKVVLAFSGGLDASFCVKYLTIEKKLEVHTVTINTGGFNERELKEAEEKAYKLGAKSHKNIDVTSDFYARCIKYMIFGNVLKNNTYPLSVSSERVFQAMAIADYAKQLKADYVAHGSTGAGNDQVRFDMIFNIMIPEIKILTPIRDNKFSREHSIDFLKKHGVEANFQKFKYSINRGLWGTSVGGAETLTSDKSLPEEAYPSQLKNKTSKEIKLIFNKGELCGINDDNLEPVEAIQALEKIASSFAVGRDIHVGDTIIGIKGRVAFEAAAPLIIIKAHHTLEKHVLTKWQLFLKDQLSMWYGNWLHEGQYLEQAMRNIEAFMDNSQKNVTGTVNVKLSPYNFQITGINSEHDLMSDKFGKYGEMNNGWTSDDVKGFTKIFGNQSAIYHNINKI